MAVMLWWLPPIVAVAIACVWAYSAQLREELARRRQRTAGQRHRSAQLRRMGAALTRPLPDRGDVDSDTAVRASDRETPSTQLDAELVP